MAKLSQDEVLEFLKGRKRSRSTVKRHFIDWRAQQNPPIPLRCDEPNCIFYREPLIWNNKELKVILDHINGVNGDNRPKNLRFLCPNCNSQQTTHGGGNKGKVELSEGGFSRKRGDGKKDYTLIAEPSKFSIRGGQATLKKVNMPNK